MKLFEFSRVHAQQTGFTLVGAVTSLAIVAVLGLVLGSISSTASDVFSNAEKQFGISENISLLRLNLEQEGTCTKNLGGQGIQFDTPIQKGFYSYDAEKGLLSSTPFLEYNKRNRGLTLRDIRIIEGPKIGSVSYLADLQLTFEVQHLITEQVVRKLPLQVIMKSGEVQECWSAKNPGALIYNQVCSILGDGSPSVLNPVTGACEIPGSKWVDGTNTEASCPVGMAPPETGDTYDLCDVRYGSGFTDSFPSVSVPMSDGTVEDVSRMPYLLRFDRSAGKCLCDWATDLSPTSVSESRCRILCIPP